MLTDEQIRQITKIWAHSGGIEHYKPPVISDRLRGLLVAMIYGVAAGFFGGFVLGRMI